MPESIDKIRKDLAETALYHGMSYAAIVGVASEIEAVTDKQERAALRREFRELHGLTAQVWARVAKRFSHYEHFPSQGIRAAAYCCQLPESECLELFENHVEHVLQPGALGLILRDVNDALDARRNGHGAKRATPLAETCACLIEYRKQSGLSFQTEKMDDYLNIMRANPAVASVLARRGKAEK